jgi:XTP/dITP diphosphohydrolase
MKKLLIATTNPAKFREYNELLKSLPLKLVSLKDLKIKRRPIEDGRNFEENAIKKAKFYSKLTKLITLADDGGLEIDYLKGEPGIKSRRWPGHKATDQELIDFALRKLKGVPWRKRKAQFRVVLALAFPGKKVLTFEGKKRGIILTEPRRKLIPGYPFRSIFYLPEYKKSFNQLSFKEEIKIGHRHRPITKIINFLKSYDNKS